MTAHHLNAADILDAHQFERTRAPAAGAAIVSVVAGPRALGRRVFAAWAGAHGMRHHVPRARAVMEIARTLGAHPPATALLFVPQATAAAAETALGAALAFAEREPQRAVGVVANVHQVEHALAPSTDLPRRIRRAVLGGLVTVTLEVKLTVSPAIKTATTELYRSDHENILHVLMRRHPEIGDLFAVNHPVRPAPGARRFEVDFWAASLRLAVEVDGLQHRTAALRQIASVVAERRKEMKTGG